MSWSYLPELEEVFSGKTFSAMLQLEPLRLSRIAGASCCSGSGICRQCGGTGYVYKIMPGTTERIQVNCTSCYSPGKCRDCGGTGRR